MAWTNMNRRLAIAAGAGLAIAGGFALKGKGASHARPQPGTFYFGNAAEPFTLDPTLSDSTWENYIIGDLMMGLATEDSMARPTPGMAERWETSADGLTWTFHLRDVQWSDGVPLTADDFLFAWRRLLEPKLAASYAYYPYIIRNAEKINAGHLPGSALGARAPDPRTLVVNLEHPAPYLIEMLMHTSMMPVPRHVVEKHGRDWAKPGTYVCNGAFLPTEWIPNDHIMAVKIPVSSTRRTSSWTG